jgi:amidase
MRRLAIAGLLMALLPGAALSQARPATTHRFTPDHFFNTFSFAHPPVLTVRSGDRVITETFNSERLNAAGRPMATGPNPQTGPFFIEEAEPGDMLKVTFHRIETNRATSRSSTLIAPYAIDPAYLRTGEREPRSEIWAIDKAAGVARTTSAGLKPGPLTVPLSPMLGCVGVAPARKEAISTSTPGAFGGNMDYAGMVAGVTVMLPVNEPGALLFIGDAHGRQGQAEIVGTGLETSVDVEFSVELVKSKTIAWPRLENADYIMVLGSARPLLQAFQHATTEMLRWLMADYGFDERTASMLMGAVVEYEIANVVDPNFTVVSKMRKTMLPAR